MRKASWLQIELERAKELGLTVQIEGRACQYNNPEALSYVLEESSYMLDYVRFRRKSVFRTAGQKLRCKFYIGNFFVTPLDYVGWEIVENMKQEASSHRKWIWRLL